MYKLIKEKAYVKTEAKRLVPTGQGKLLHDFLNVHFSEVLAIDYTARLEAELDRIASGERARLDVLREFWTGFQPQVKRATEYALAQWRTRNAPKPLTLRPVEEGAHEQPTA